MSAELTLTALISKFWAPLAAIAAFILSHVRLETKFNAEKEAVRERMNRLEDGMTKGLEQQRATMSEIRTDIKTLTAKVDENHNHANELNARILERLSK